MDDMLRDAGINSDGTSQLPASELESESAGSCLPVGNESFRFRSTQDQENHTVSAPVGLLNGCHNGFGTQFLAGKRFSRYGLVAKKKI